MSTRVQSAVYPLKETQTKSIYTYEEDYYPAKHERVLYRNRSKLVDYDSNDYRSYDECDDSVKRQLLPPKESRPRRSVKASNDDVDRLYRQSKEKFASWDIRDLDERRRANQVRSVGGKSTRRIYSRDQPDVEVEDAFANGDSSSSPTPTRRTNGTLRREKRSNSAARRNNSESLDRQSGVSRERKSTSCSEDDDEKHRRLLKRGNNRRQYHEDVARSESVKRKNEKNAGLNRGFRAFIDKFRSKSADKERKKAQRAWRREPLMEIRGYDGLRDKSSSSREIYPLKESKAERGHRVRDFEYGNSGVTSPRSSDDEKPKVKVYKLKYHEIKQEPRRSSPDDENSYRRFRDPYSKENDNSKRRSYAFESSPEDFEVTMQKYDRGGRNETEVQRRSSFSDKAHSDSSQRSSLKDHSRPKVVRKISFQDRQHESIRTKPSRSRVSERHSRPLTPPENQSPLVLKDIEEELSKHDDTESPAPMSNHRDDSIKSKSKENPKRDFSMKEWYESNRQFASKYLKEHSKIKELSTFSDVSAKDEFVFGSPKDSKIFYEIERHEVCEESIEEDTDDGYGIPISYQKTSTRIEDSKRRSDKNARAGDIIRKYHHESVEEEDEQRLQENEEKDEKGRRSEMTKKSEQQGRSFVMPSRRIWNYRDGV
ncbi:hypothetical protein QAD02_000372 [Eretmocerus hayati]|uniref:Uncharacterized protein n=1 Tax=Eretmocerus hayati TaxID=131215 RepID=A0ACC2NDA8_9HYME|nr:hypothetical protein QAD02_000372 [Eretmocerus hayati]